MLDQQEYAAHALRHKLDHQATYNDILQKQIQFRNGIQVNYGAMTENERKLNKKELAVVAALIRAGL